MKKYLTRMAVALLISMGCYAGITYWYFHNLGRANLDGKKSAVARLNETLNEVQRKPIKRVIWEGVRKNDELYPGEAIRTAPDAEASIFFMKTGTTIHLQPDSLIVLEETDAGLSLDFLQGNLLVQGAGAGAADGLTLKTDKGQITLQSADVSLSKDQAGQVNLEVFKGKAELQQGDKKVAIEKDKAATLNEKGVSVSKDALQVMSPQAGESLFLNLVKGEKLTVQWKPLPAGYKVSADIGTSRTRLKQLATGAEGDAGKIVAGVKPGRWFLRLRAENVDPLFPPLRSIIVPFEVEPKTPPSLLSPASQAALLKRDVSEPSLFKWFNRHVFKAQVLEIAKDNKFKSIHKKVDLDGTTTMHSEVMPDGQFYWRVTGYLQDQGKLEPLTSLSDAFTVTSNWQIKPPALSSPIPEQKISSAEVLRRKGVPLKWELAPGVKRYRVTVSRQTEKGTTDLFDQKVETPLTKLSDATPGTYIWKVASIDPKDDSEKFSEPRTFYVDELPPIEWVKSSPTNEYEYHTPTPSLAAEWKPLDLTPSAYRYRVVADGQNITDGKWQTTKQNRFDIPLPNDGRYLAVIEALDSSGQAIAASSIENFSIRAKPLLPAPLWASDAPSTFKTDARGNISFTWQEVDGAKQYQLFIETDEGQVVQQKSVSRNTASLKRLKPGQYSIRVKAIDTYERAGPPGEVKPVEVPNVSDIKAPKIKTLKVK
ncbi:MAG: hypothetical protein AB7F86_13390 [Bdellovibrionales bacterium]